MTARRHKNFIDGSFRKAERYIDNFNPSDTSDTVGPYAGATPAEVAEAGHVRLGGVGAGGSTLPAP